MSKSQHSLRIGLVAVTLVLISSFVYATALSSSFEWFGFARASAENTPVIETETKTEKVETPVPLVLGTCDVATAGLPIEIESTGGVIVPTSYANLSAAIAAINTGTHTGTINVEVCFNSTETAAMF